MSFDSLAPGYRFLERLFAGSLLQDCRLHYLKEVAGCRRALIIGEGPGSFLIELLQRSPHIEVVCVERSSGMIREMQRRLRQSDIPEARVKFVVIDIRQWNPQGMTFDLIVTPFVLDCFEKEDLKKLIEKFTSAATPDARWLLSDFQLPPNGLARWRAKIIIGLLYGFFHLTTEIEPWSLTPPEPFLEAAGFSIEKKCESNFGLVYSSVWRRVEF